MNQKITEENRERFYAQYWGQNVGFREWSQTKHVVGYYFMSLPVQTSCVHLKPLSSISDEDAIDFGLTTVDPSALSRIKAIWGKTWAYSCYENNEWKAEQLDFLRSRGYALPWNGITVEQQIEAGWVKLVE